MEVIEAILYRRSIRRYTSQNMNENQLETLLKAAMYAPSAVNKQPWHFVVFRDEKTMQKIMDIHQNASMLKNANVAILVCWDELLQHDTGYGPVDCANATQNILLAAYGMGLGAAWVGVYPRQKRIDALHEIFNLPEHVKPFSVISLGYPDEQKAFPDRFKKERIHTEVW